MFLVGAGNKLELKGLVENMRRSVEALNIFHENRGDGLSIVTISVGATNLPPSRPKDRRISSAKLIGRFMPPRPADATACGFSIPVIRWWEMSSGKCRGRCCGSRSNKASSSLTYQPIQKVSSGKIVAFEALMRVKLLDGTMISPAVFIPVAERTGAIHELRAVGLSALPAREFALLGTEIPVVSVNVSAIQLRSPSFAASVAGVLAETGVSPLRIALEVTEGLEIEANSDILRSITELQKLGVQIWLDDFGTGFAGLSWLRLFDFDMIKIDRSFLHESANPHGENMLRDMIGLIRNRGREILIEGVENDMQVRLIRTLNVDLMQGYKLGRPASGKWAREKFVDVNAAKLTLVSRQS